METPSHEASDPRASLASVAGYLALVFLFLPLLAPGVDHPSDGHAIGAAIGVGITSGLAVRGARFGTGGGRLAAKVALGVLSLWLLAILAASLVRWKEVLWYWRH